MARSSCDELTTLLTHYVTIKSSIIDIERLRDCLQSASTEVVYHLLSTTKSETFRNTAIHKAAWRNTPEVITCLFDSVTEEQKYQLLMEQNVLGATALHCAAYNGYSDIIAGICEIVTVKQRYQLLTVQDQDKYTVLHFAAWGGQSKLVTSILDSIESAQQIQLLEITDSYNRTTLDLALLNNKRPTANLIKSYLSTGDELRGELTSGIVSRQYFTAFF